MSKVSVRRHLRELQWRMILVAIFFIAGATAAYYTQEWLVPFLMDPLHGQKLVYLNPAGGFSFIFLITIYAGLALALPILIQQLYAFVRPALPPAAQKKSAGILIGSFLLLVAGIAFGYLIAVPSALNFLYGFADEFVEASLTADSYLNFMIAYTVGIGLVFQLPLLLLLLHTIKPMTPGGLLKSEKWVVLVAFIVAAIITPTPDPVNQFIIAVPVIIIYQIGVVLVLVSIAKTKRTAKKAIKTSPITETASAVVESSPVAPPALVTTTAAVPIVATSTAQSTPRPQPRPIDGMVRRTSRQMQRAHQNATETRAAQLQQRVAAEPQATNNRPLFVDGISGPVRRPVSS